MASRDASVIVPVRDGGAAFADCLDALASQRDAPAFEVIVVDNGSRDGTAELAGSHRLGVRLIREERPGSYAARNAGIAVAEGDVLAFTDADCTPHPGWLAAGCAALGAGADLVGGAIAMQRSAHPTVVERYDRAVYLRQEDLVRNHGWAVTANLFVRRSVIDHVGPFDATLPSGGDRDFCLRATRAGCRLRFAEDAVIGHRPRTRLREIWGVNRRIGRGMRTLTRRGELPAPWRSPDLRQPLTWVMQCIAADGPALRRRQVVGVHAVAMSARWLGLLTGR